MVNKQCAAGSPRDRNYANIAITLAILNWNSELDGKYEILFNFLTGELQIAC